MNNANIVPEMAKPPKTAPLKIERKEQAGLLLTWRKDTTPVLLPAERLRQSCPCAVCREERGEGNHSAPLGPSLKPKKSALQVISHAKEEQLALVEIWAVGNYALGIRWGDGHDDGIYTFEYLWGLCSNT